MNAPPPPPCQFSISSHEATEYYNSVPSPATLLSAIESCTDWRAVLAGSLPTELGKGGFGRVFSMNMQKNGHPPQQMAIKVENFSRFSLLKFHEEAKFGKVMAQKEIGPQIFDTFYINIRRVGGFVGIIMMERFTMDAFDFLFNPHLHPHTTLAEIRDAIGQMGDIIDRIVMPPDPLFCSDVKPGNFLVNFNPLRVRMSDFGPPFCTVRLPTYIRTIRDTARDKLQRSQTAATVSDRRERRPDRYLGAPLPEAVEDIHRTTISMDDLYTNILFGNIMKIALILRLREVLPRRYSQTKWSRFLKQFLPFLREICDDNTRLENITESIANQEFLYDSFMHNVALKRDASFASNTGERREYVIQNLKRLCDIKRQLEGVKPFKGKPGIMASIKRRLRPQGGGAVLRERRRRTKKSRRRRRRRKRKRRKTKKHHT